MLCMLDDDAMIVVPKVSQRDESLLAGARGEELKLSSTLGFLLSAAWMAAGVVLVVLTDWPGQPQPIDAKTAFLTPPIAMAATFGLLFIPMFGFSPNDPVFTRATTKRPMRLDWPYGIMAVLTVIMQIAALAIMAHAMTLAADSLALTTLVGMTVVQAALLARFGGLTPYRVLYMTWLARHVQQQSGRLGASLGLQTVPLMRARNAREVVRDYNAAARACPARGETLDRKLVSEITEASASGTIGSIDIDTNRATITLW